MSNTTDVSFNLQNTLRGHTKAINLLAISPDQSRLISVGVYFLFFLIDTTFNKEFLGDDSKVIIWSVVSGEKLFVVERPFNGAATAASWASRDSSRFVIGFASGDLHVFLEDGKVM
jgi:WD40 repeat protein